MISNGLLYIMYIIGAQEVSGEANRTRFCPVSWNMSNLSHHVVRHIGSRVGLVRLPPTSPGRAQPEHAAATGCLTAGRGGGKCRPNPGHIRFRPREREVGRVNEARNLI